MVETRKKGCCQTKGRVWSIQLLFSRVVEPASDKWQSGVVYLDLFSGPAICEVEGTGERFPGSPLIAACAPKAFSKLILCELDPASAHACEQRLKAIAPSVPHIVFQGNCNEEIDRIVAEIPRGALTLAFVDPEGLHAKFETLREIAQRGAVDFLILLADAMDILRNVERYFHAASPKLDEFLGPNSDWRRKWSATGNSQGAAGGYLVLGLDDKTRAVEKCDQRIGSQPTKDYLSQLVEQSVDYPLRSFRIYSVRETVDATNHVFVIEIDDSHAAPHQSKHDKIYYWRLDGRTERAPHFHTELLRNRYTRSVLRIVSHEVIIRKSSDANPPLTLDIDLTLVVENASMQHATVCGAQIKQRGTGYHWRTRGQESQKLGDGLIMKCKELLPMESTKLLLNLRAHHSIRPYESRIRTAEDLLADFAVHVTPISQNYVGDPYYIGPTLDESINPAVARQAWINDFIGDLRSQGFED